MSLTTAYAHSFHPSFYSFKFYFTRMYPLTYMYVHHVPTCTSQKKVSDSLELVTDDSEWMLGAEIRSSFKAASTPDPSHLPSTQHSPSFLENCLVDQNSQQSCLNFPSALVIDVYLDTRLSSCLNAGVESTEDRGTIPGQMSCSKLSPIWNCPRLS